MARVGTPLLNLGTWLDAENPTAGSQVADSDYLNGDKIKLDTAIGTEHNADGTHKADKIDGPSLKSTCADGVTLELTGSPRKARIKDLGVSSAKISHDNTRTKSYLTFAIDPVTGYGIINGVQTSALVGVPMPRGGCVTSISLVQTSGTVTHNELAYDVAGAGHFGAGSTLTIYFDGDDLDTVIDGTLTDPHNHGFHGAVGAIVTLEIELDN